MVAKASTTGNEETTEITLSKTANSLFNIPNTDRVKAVAALLSGRTPAEEVRLRPGRGGKKQRYVNVYYMTRQIGLLTGFRWESEPLEEVVDLEHNEVRAKMKVTIYDEAGNSYSHTSWGGKDIAKWATDFFDARLKEPGTNKPLKLRSRGDIISIADDLKAAYSDGIKKCLSYFGIASDIYGGKEGESYETGEEQAENQLPDVLDAATTTQEQAATYLETLVKQRRLRWSEVCAVLTVKSPADITDHVHAYNLMQEFLRQSIKEGDNG